MIGLWKALAHLHPDKHQWRDFEIRATSDGAEYIAAWNLPQPQPTTDQLAAAIVAYDAAEAQRVADATTLRQGILSAAQSAVGVPYASVTNAMLKALLWILLWRAGALNKDLTVKPLVEWVRD